jgi:hypothetical protein
VPIEVILRQMRLLVKAMFYRLSPEFSARDLCNVLALQ